MAKDPAFLFYSNDFLTGVSDLTMEERGQFITLMCLQHQKGGLTKKAVAIAVASASKDVMKKFEVDENGLLYNKRLQLEIDKRKNFTEKQRQRALDGWEKRKKKKSGGNAKADATALPIIENENVIVNKEELLLLWLNYRAEIKKEVKNEKTLAQLSARFSREPFEKCKWVVMHSIENQYQGLFWDKYRPSQGGGSNSPTDNLVF